MKIYLIGGKSGSGKREVAKIINKYCMMHKKRAIITEYSKYLKMYAREIIDWDGNDPKPRKFLQDIGTTIKENMDMPKMLINRMIEDIKIYELYYDVVIISDVRFPEEIEDIKSNFSDVASIYVINQFEASKLSLEEQMHVTETALENYSDFDITITNDDLSKLDSKVTSFIESRE